MTTLAFCDVETTGLDPERHEIYEIGLILRDDDGIECSYRWWLPVDLSRADVIALNVGRYHDRKPRLGLGPFRWLGADRGWDPRSVQSVADDFSELTWGAHLVGAVPSFDAERLSRWLRAHAEAGR